MSQIYCKLKIRLVSLSFYKLCTLVFQISQLLFFFHPSSVIVIIRITFECVILIIRTCIVSIAIFTKVDQDRKSMTSRQLFNRLPLCVVSYWFYRKSI